MISAKDERIKDLTINDFPEPMREIADIIGFKNTVMLMVFFGGSKVYIHKPDVIEQKWRNAEIRAEYDGNNRRKLALKYGLSEVTITNIIKGSEEEETEEL